jgi:hypothetical protein
MTHPGTVRLAIESAIEKVKTDNENGLFRMVAKSPAAPPVNDADFDRNGYVTGATASFFATVQQSPSCNPVESKHVLSANVEWFLRAIAEIRQAIVETKSKPNGKTTLPSPRQFQLSVGYFFLFNLADQLTLRQNLCLRHLPTPHRVPLYRGLTRGLPLR